MKLVRISISLVAWTIVFLTLHIFVVGVASWLGGIYKGAFGPGGVSYLHEIVSASIIEMAVSLLIYGLLAILGQIYFRSRLESFVHGCLKLDISDFCFGLAPLIVSPIIAIAFAHVLGRVEGMNDGMRWHLLPVSAVAVFALASVEEVMFRGIYLKLLALFVGAPLWASVFVQAFVFAVLHGKVARESGLNFASYMAAGVLFALICMTTGRIWIAVLSHAWLNVWSGLLGGSSALWFAGALYEDCGESWVLVHRLTILICILMLVRKMSGRGITGHN